MNESEFEGLIEDFRKESQGLRRELGRQSNSSASTININAGGFGVWMATTCCLVSVIACGFLALLVFEQKREIDDLNHYLNAIYMMAPHLKPDEESE